MARYLIVANQTIGGEQLTAKLDELSSAGPCTFRFLVPVTDTEGLHQWDYPPIDRVIPDSSRTQPPTTGILARDLPFLSGDPARMSTN